MFITTTSSPRDIKKVLNALTKAKVLISAYKFPLGKEYSIDANGKLTTTKVYLLHIQINEDKKTIYQKVIGKLENLKEKENFTINS